MRCPTHGEGIRFFFVSKFKFKQMKRTIMKKSKSSICPSIFLTILRPEACSAAPSARLSEATSWCSIRPAAKLTVGICGRAAATTDCEAAGRSRLFLY